MGILVSESWVNATRNNCIGDSEVYETNCNTPGEVYRAMQRENGRCVGAVYKVPGYQSSKWGTNTWVAVKYGTAYNTVALVQEK